MSTHSLDKPTTVYLSIFTLTDGSTKYYIGKRLTDRLKGYYGSGKLLKDIEYVSRARVVLEECKDQIEGAIVEKEMIKLAREKYGDDLLNIAEGGRGGQTGLKREPRNLTIEHKEAISKGKLGKRQNREGKHWEDEDKLYALWIERNRLSRHKFRKLLVSLGYDDINYHQMITLFTDRYNA